MGYENIKVAICDGQNCGKRLPNPGDGLVFHGSVFDTGPETKVAIIGMNGADHKVFCWDCIGKKVTRMPVKVVEKEKIVYRDVYRDSSPSYPGDWERNNSGGRATGPVPPPDTIRAVGFVASLAADALVDAEDSVRSKDK